MTSYEEDEELKSLGIRGEVLRQYNAWRISQGMGPVGVRSKREARTVNVSDGSWERLKAIAEELGYTTNRGRQGGSISDMLEALGEDLLNISYIQS